MATINPLIWKDEYSVDVEEIDNQHKNFIATVNKLVEIVNAVPDEKAIMDIVQGLIVYKHVHFATEEKYFHQFNFEGAVEHEAAHKDFNERLEKLQNEYKGKTIELAFALVDFLENWLIDHLLTMDQKYKKCFSEHGLK
jgi:hemerythrin